MFPFLLALLLPSGSPLGRGSLPPETNMIRKIAVLRAHIHHVETGAHTSNSGTVRAQKGAPVSSEMRKTNRTI